MTLKECYKALELADGATLSEVKRAYRKLAFALHPDLNPDVPDASRRFQILNEAYVKLSQSPLVAGTTRQQGPGSDDPADPRAREEARKAYQKASAGQKPSGPKKEAATDGEFLKDILNDPFARRVFEDIYSHIRHETRTQSSARPTASPRPQATTKKATPQKASAIPEDGLVDRFKGWMRKQIDDEQVLHLPGAMLVPGARVRLHIQHGITGEPQAIELTLPPEFVPGKSVRLRGMGKHVGKWRGDLYVRIEAE